MFWAEAGPANNIAKVIKNILIPVIEPTPPNVHQYYGGQVEQRLTIEAITHDRGPIVNDSASDHFL